MTDKTTPAGELAVRESFGAEELVGRGLSPEAAAAAAKALVEARFIVAMKNPRDVDLFMLRLTKECARPSAAAIFLYSRPVGPDKFVTGFSARFAETANRLWKNTYTISRIAQDGPEECLLSVEVLDLEDNVSYGSEAVIKKTVERRPNTSKDREILRVRTTSRGEQVNIVAATEAELRNLIGAERSKLIRDQTIRLLPRDILDEARLIIDRTLEAADAKDPDAAKKKVLVKFGAFGVEPAQLVDYLGKPLEALNAKDLQELRVLHNGLAEGAYTWGEIVRMKGEPAANEPPAERDRRQSLTEKIKAARDALKGESPKEEK